MFPRLAALAGLTVLVAVVGTCDYWSGPEISFSIFFLLPIALGAWYLGPMVGLALAFLSAIGWLMADTYGGRPYSSPTTLYWNASVRLGFFTIIAMALAARREAERRILELMRIKSDFTSHVSHELRTPLTCIREGIEIVKDESVGPLNEKQRTHLETAKRNVDRLSRLLDDVLDFQKLEAGRMELESESCDINRLVTQSVEGFALAAQKRNLQLDLELAPALPAVHCDPDRVSQVLSNLLSNALRFTDHGRICVSTGVGSGCVRVSVEDSGMGIAKEDLPRLFQEFTQLEGARGKRRLSGTGLGLAIAARLVRGHGGELRADSVLGRGSTFWFTLPAENG